jgi:hypothetical protein
MRWKDGRWEERPINAREIATYRWGYGAALIVVAAAGIIYGGEGWTLLAVTIGLSAIFADWTSHPPAPAKEASS